MNTKWKVEGAEWEDYLIAPLDMNPDEVATRVVERIAEHILKANPTQFAELFGMVMIVSNPEMKSEDQHIICYSPLILANCGLYKQAEELNAYVKALSQA